MRFSLRLLFALGVALSLGLVVRPAHASTTIPLNGQFIENASKQAGCPTDTCGTGYLMPLGAGTDSIVDGVPGCGGCAPNVKTFYFANGTLTTLETFVGGSCSNPTVGVQGTCGLFTGQTDSTITGGTGAYAGATGTLVNIFQISAGQGKSSIARYTGTLILP